MFRIEHNVETGEIKQIELSAAETKQLEKQYAQAKADNDAEKAEAQENLQAKTTLLNRLGITAEEAKLLLQ